ncbi:MAG: patatin-like phospholipase family protein, partial [Chloroflexi bacterium]|nr:patatin-like phospholipase family protein [Chloroflexota bacterium]
MKPFRKNVAIAIDGGGIRGIIAAKALNMLEKEAGTPSYKIFRLCAGTSTGSILAGGIAAGVDGDA